MGSNRLIANALLARDKGLLNLIMFLVVRFVFILGGISFLAFIIGDFLFNYKSMQFFGIADSIKQSAFFGFIVVGLIPAVVCFLVLESLYWKKK